MFFLENILKHVRFYDIQGRNAPYILFMEFQEQALMYENRK